MAMRLHELHPSLVHFPLTLLPAAVLSDLVGHLAGNRVLREVGRRAMPLAAASAAVAAIAGLAAQEEVDADGDARDMLVTHRNLNLTLGAIAAGMAVWRQRRRRPTPAYLALGLVGLGAMSYTAYLGGHMVYEHGVGVRAAGGVRRNVPELTPAEAPRAARRFARDVERAVPHAIEDVTGGDLAPTLRRGRRAQPERRA